MTKKCPDATTEPATSNDKESTSTATHHPAFSFWHSLEDEQSVATSMPSRRVHMDSVPHSTVAAVAAGNDDARTNQPMVELVNDDAAPPLPLAQTAAVLEAADEEAGANVNRNRALSKGEEVELVEVIEDGSIPTPDFAVATSIDGGSLLQGKSHLRTEHEILPQVGAQRIIPQSPALGDAQQPPAVTTPEGSIENANSTDQLRGEESIATTALPTSTSPVESSTSYLPLFHNVEATLVPEEPVYDAVAMSAHSSVRESDSMSISIDEQLTPSWWNKKQLTITGVLLLVIVAMVATVMGLLLSPESSQEEVVNSAPSSRSTDAPSSMPTSPPISQTQSLSSKSTLSPFSQTQGLGSRSPMATTNPSPAPQEAASHTSHSTSVKLAFNEGISSSVNSVWLNKNVALQRSTAVVGAPYNDNERGAAFVFVRGNGNWLQKAKLEPPSGVDGGRFGWSVDINGDTCVIGAGYDDNMRGSAYVYVRRLNYWMFQAKLRPPDGASEDQFGGSVAIYGDYIVVGAHRDDDNGSSSGSAHVFTRIGGNWVHQAKLLAPDGEAYDYFGYDVAIHQDSIVVGTSGDWSGSAHVFVRNGADWIHQAKLLTPDAAALDHFGRSIAIYCDYIVVGAWADDDNGDTSGSVHVFVHDGGSWPHHSKLLAPDGQANDWFGYSVAIHGDFIIVGAQYDDDSGTNSGSAHVFARNKVSWDYQAKLLAPDATADSRFGRSVAIYNGTALIGSHGGDAYVFPG